MAAQDAGERALKREKERQKGDKLFCEKWYKRADLKELEKEHGGTYKRGKFASYEKRIVSEIIDVFLAERGIEREDFVDDLIRKKGLRRGWFNELVRRISAKLPGNRPLVYIYDYIVRTIHPDKCRGRYTKEEDKQILDFYSMHGPDWSKLALQMERTRSSLSVHYWYLERRGQVPWGPEEVATLRSAMEEARRAGRNEAGGAWGYVSRKTGKSITRCMRMWFDVSRRQEECGWGDREDWTLCQKLYDLCVEDETEVNWVELAREEFGTWTHTKLKVRWRQLSKRVETENRAMEDVLEELITKLAEKINPATV
ncbi:MAG: uncharacterized protein A8A55_2709 [Amphiamblys sp. WSBS2006]|nr:MAG: uncharacterized protein A8A55_2709 [Amphiamblys sp. WSBS2006]